MLKFQRIGLLAILMGLGLMECPSTLAQILTVTEDTSIKASIAATQPTRISVMNDRITLLRGKEGAYTTSNDNNTGTVFLKPNTTDSNQPFYVFITTEQNHNYLLQLTPTTQLSAGLLILKPSDQSIITAQHWEMDSPYMSKLSQLMAAMVSHTPPEGYEVIPVNAKKATTVGTQLKWRLKTVYSGAYLQGKIYEVTNASKAPITLVERLFYQPGDRAIALQADTLTAGGKTFLYKVTRHG